MTLTNIAKGFAIFQVNNVFFNKIKSQQQQKSLHKQSMPEAGIEPGTSSTVVWSLATRSPCQLNVSIEIELFNCFNVMGRNKQSQICGSH